MKQRYVVLLSLLVLGATGAAAQELDMTGQWQVYRVDRLAVYTLDEHAAALQGVQLRPSNLTLGADGTVASDVQGLVASRWQMSEGFVVFAGSAGNIFFMPRPLSADIVFLVRVDVLERNAQITNIVSRTAESLIAVRPSS